MARKYNITKKSDLRRLERDLNKQAKEIIRKASHQVICPSCGHTFSANPGKVHCPHCRQIINFVIK